MSNIDCFGIYDFNVAENTYILSGDKYFVKDLIEMASKEEPFELPLAGVDIGTRPWGDMDIKHFCYHVRRMTAAEMKYPVILDVTGYICDGWHRVAKSIINGQKTIMAVRLKTMPKPLPKDD